MQESSPEQPAGAPAPPEFVSMEVELARIRANLARMSKERNAVMRDLARARTGGKKPRGDKPA